MIHTFLVKIRFLSKFHTYPHFSKQKLIKICYRPLPHAKIGPRNKSQTSQNMFMSETLFTYIYTHIYIYIYTYIHTHIQIVRLIILIYYEDLEELCALYFAE